MMPETIAIPETVTVSGESLLDTIALLFHLSDRLSVAFGDGQDVPLNDSLNTTGDNLFSEAFVAHVDNDDPLYREAGERAKALSREWATRAFADFADLDEAHDAA